MRLHFTAELILELVTQFYNLEKVGAHIAEHKARIDFKSDTNVSQYFDRLLTAYNKIIDADLPIHKEYADKATQRRYWKIEGFAQVPWRWYSCEQHKRSWIRNVKARQTW